MRNEVTDLLLETLSKYGLKGIVSDRTKHLEVSWEGIAGPRFVIAPRTPSDWRSALNCRSDLRKMLRKDNQPLMEDKPTSFQKAMSLPQESIVTIATRERALQKDVEVLCELVLELQDQNNELRQDVRSLLEQMKDVTVVSTVMSTVKFAGQQVVEEHPVLQLKETPVIKPRERPSGERLLEILSFTWKDIGEILQEMGIHTLGPESRPVRSRLQYYKKIGLVENGARGMWRRKPDGGSAFQ